MNKLVQPAAPTAGYPSKESLSTSNYSPCSIEMEQAVIGALLINNQSLEKVNDLLQTDDFYHAKHRFIYTAIKSFAAECQPYDFLTIKEKLKITAQLENVSEAYLFELVNNTGSAANIEAYARMVKEKSNLRSLLNLPQEIISLVTSGGTSKQITEYISGRVDELNKYSGFEWGEPQPIQAELLPVEVLLEEMIPEPVREFISDEAIRKQCPIDFMVIPLLTTISSIIGAECGIRPKKEDDWLVMPNLWGCIVGPPGIMKSPAAAVSIGFIQKLEEKEEADHAMKLNSYQADLEANKIEKDAVRSELSKTHKIKISGVGKITITVEQLKIKLKNLQEPEKPRRRRFKTNDTTVEKLGEILSENPRGLLLTRDELMGLLRTWDKTGHESDRAFFLEAWDGKGSYTSDRIGRGTVIIKNVCISIFGTTQPDKLTRYLHEALNGANDGLIQRFQLAVYPDQSNWELNDQAPNLLARERVLKLIHTLAYMDFSKYGASQSKSDETSYFRFNQEAQKIFYEWFTDLEKKLRGDDYPLIQEHLSKYRKLMPALALIFHLIDLADGSSQTEVSEINARMACVWCDYLESHARRIYALAINVETQAMSKLAEKILNGKLKDKFTVRDVYRQKGILKDKKLAKAACEELVELGWLREVITPTAKGQKQKVSYLINPNIKKEENR